MAYALGANIARAVGVALCVVTVGVLPGCSGNSTNPPAFDWSTLASLPVPRTDHAVVVLGGIVYVLGGFSGSTLARVDAFDPATNVWTRKADMPTARRSFAAGAINGKIYVSAGMSYTDPNGITYITTTEEYDPATDTWTTRAPCPLDPATNSVLGNVAITGGVANGRLFVMVFNTNIAGFTKTHEYDPATNTWTTAAAPPFSYARYSMGAVGDKLYLLASETGQDGQIAEYNAVDDVWIIRASLPGVWWASLGGVNGDLYAFGGVAVDQAAQPTRLLADVWKYDPTKDRWDRRGQMNVARHTAAAAEVAGTVYLIGGSSSTNAISPVPLASVEKGVATR